MSNAGELSDELMTKLMLLGDGWVYQWSYHTFLKRNKDYHGDIVLDADTMKELTPAQYYSRRVRVDSGRGHYSGV